MLARHCWARCQLGFVRTSLPMPASRGRPTFVLLLALAWADRDLGGTVLGDLVLTGQTLELRNVSCNLGEGELRGVLVFPLTARRTGFFSVTLERVEASDVLLPYPELAEQIRGPLDVVRSILMCSAPSAVRSEPRAYSFCSSPSTTIAIDRVFEGTSNRIGAEMPLA